MLSDEMLQYVEAEELVAAPLFLERLPDEPAGAIGVYTRQSSAPDTTVGLERHAIQFIVRSGDSDPREGYTVAETLYNALHGLVPTSALVAGGASVKQIMANHVPAHIGRDAKGRHEWSLNFTVWVYNPERSIS